MEKPRIWLSPPHMGGDEKTFVEEVFQTNWISPAGPPIEAFENDLIAYSKVSYCVALSSGTAAIHLALILLGVERGDEVICSTFTFAGSCNPVVYVGATPVFVDSEQDTWNMDPELLREAIEDRIRKRGKKPKAIILVHLYGNPARIDQIMSVARRFEIPVVEDAAEAIGSSYAGVKLGNFGDLAVYSFNGNKIITTSGGGALLSDREDWIKTARFLATQARDPYPHYEHSHIGYNYRLSAVSAAIGRGQMRVLDHWVKKRRSIFEYYQSLFSDFPEIQFQKEPESGFSNRWLTTITLEHTDNHNVVPEEIRLLLDAENIESRPLWKPMHLQPIFETAPAYVNGVSERLFRKGLCLPSGSGLETIDQNRIAKVVIEALQTGLL